MLRLQGFQTSQKAYRGCCLSIGNFDGVHRGHVQIVQRLKELADRLAAPVVILTFEPHPLSLLRPEHVPPRLSTPQQRAELLANAGADVVVEYPTDWALLRLSPEEFFHRIVEQELAARQIVEGPNFYFGRNRSGDIQTLAELCSASGIALEIQQPMKVNGQLLSSSLTRQCLQAGDVTAAANSLGRPYSFQGVVARGSARGRDLGFPTANLEEIGTLVPADGVYAGQCRIAGKAISAAIHIGPNPTFGEERRKVEVHLIDFDQDLYGQTLEVAFHHRLRGLREFAGPADLQRQLQADIAATRRLFASSESE